MCARESCCCFSLWYATLWLRTQAMCPCCCGADDTQESCCRFCKQPLPQWRQTLQSTSRRRNDSQQQQQTPPSPPPAADAAAAVPPLPAQQVAPLMSIQFHGHTYWLQVHSGQGGVDQFKADVRRLLGLSGDDQFEITFECQMPGDGECRRRRRRDGREGGSPISHAACLGCGGASADR